MHERTSAPGPAPTTIDVRTERVAPREPVQALVAHELLNIVLSMRLRLDLLDARVPAASVASADTSTAQADAMRADLAALRAAVDRLAALADSMRTHAPPPEAPPHPRVE